MTESSSRPRRVKGFVMTSQDILQAGKLTLQELGLLIHLHSFQFDQRLPFPSIRTLAERTGLKPRQIQYLCRSLESKGMIKRILRPGRTNEFRLTPAVQCTPAPECTPTPAVQCTPGVQYSAPEEEEGNKRGGDGGSGEDLELSLIANSCSPAVSAFDRFWTVYPRKRGKEAARKAWKKLKPDRSLVEIIIRAVEAEKKAGWQDPQFIPYPATWLNRGQWQDEEEGPGRSLTAWRTT